MHFPEPPKFSSSVAPEGPWYKELTGYHWFVLVVAALGWLFDTMDQQLFNLARVPAMKELLAPSPTSPASKEMVAEYAGYATAIFLVGWAVGGIAFGIMGDRIGRAKTMLFTILIYSLFTGLSALSQGFWDFALYRFLTGLGVGGEFAVGVALVAEVMPDRARPMALGWLQALSAIGNISAALIGLVLSKLESAKVIGAVGEDGSVQFSAWRIMFVIGTVPALLAILIRRKLKEPERWQSAAVGDELHKKLGSVKELFTTPKLRHNAIVGLMMAFSGVVGLWGIGFFSFDLLRTVFEPVLQKQFPGDPAAVSSRLGEYVAWTSVLQNLGGFCGIQLYMWMTNRTNRKTAFFYSFILALLSTAFTFYFLGKFAGIYDVLWMIPLMGCCQLSLFGGYAIYFPELFPTRLRSTGTSFCYNVGRLVAAVGPFTLGVLTSKVFYAHPEPMRMAGLSMCGVFLIGLCALPFAPETKGQPLPE